MKTDILNVMYISNNIVVLGDIPFFHSVSFY